MRRRKQTKTRFTVVGHQAGKAPQRYTVSVDVGNQGERDLDRWARRRQRLFFVVAVILVSAFLLYSAL